MADIDWAKSMQQTFEYYKVDPVTWRDKERVYSITSSSISIDSENETLGSASFDTTEALDECYLRTYLICVQNGETFKFPLGTHLVQTPGKKFNGRIEEYSLDAYTPLLELKDTRPPFGYSVLSGVKILESVSNITSYVVRAPVVSASSDDTLTGDFVSDYENDTWLTFLSDMLGSIDYEFNVDELGRIMFAPYQDPNSMTPVWTFTDDDGSILYPEISVDRDLYSLPNVVEVMYSSSSGYLFSRVVNDDDNSPVSIPSRGREIVHRVINPEDIVDPVQEQLDDYARNLLVSLSSLEYTLDYKHGYCPVRVGDCVLIDYKRSGFSGIKAVVKSQKIDCTTGCSVSEKATFTKRLWGW